MLLPGPSAFDQGTISVLLCHQMTLLTDALNAIMLD